MIRSELVITLAAALVAATLGARQNVRFVPTSTLHAMAAANVFAQPQFALR